MPALDIFNNNAFSVVEMTTAINLIDYMPGRIGQMGIFSETGVATTSVDVEFQDGKLSLIPTRLRREPTNYNKPDKRRIKTFKIPHIPLDDAILADDIQNVRKFGTPDELATAADIVSTRMKSMVNKHAVTQEYHRIGAIKGIILDADGTTVIYNLFDEFSITQTVVAFDLSNTAASMREKCTEVLAAVETNVGAATIDHVHCFAGSTWFADFVEHPTVKEAWKRYNDGEFLRTDQRYKGFVFNDILFEQYRGKVGAIDFVDTDEAAFFPVGVPDLFERFNGPGNFVGAANTIGLPFYAMQERMKMDRGIEIHTESNPLHICSRPGALIKGTADAPA